MSDKKPTKPTVSNGDAISTPPSQDETPPTTTPPIQDVEELKSFRVWAEELNIPDWQVDGIVAGEKWAEGFEVTQSTFTTAIKTMLETELR